MQSVSVPHTAKNAHSKGRKIVAQRDKVSQNKAASSTESTDPGRQGGKGGRTLIKNKFSV